MTRALLCLLALCLSAPVAAQKMASFNWGGVNVGQVMPSMIYVPLLPTNVEFNDLPEGSVWLTNRDFSFTVPGKGDKPRLVEITGQLWVLLEPWPAQVNAVVKVFANTACSNDTSEVILPAQIGGANGVVPLNIKWRFMPGTVLRLCIYSIGTPTSYVQGVKSHSHFEIVVH